MAENHSKVLLVEGKQDLRVIPELVEEGLPFVNFVPLWLSHLFVPSSQEETL